MAVKKCPYCLSENVRIDEKNKIYKGETVQEAECLDCGEKFLYVFDRNRTSSGAFMSKTDYVEKIANLSDKERTIFTTEKTFEEVLQDCRLFIEKESRKIKTDSYDEKKAKDRTIKLIYDFIQTREPSVQGMTLGELKTKLVEEITQFGILTGPYYDEAVSEIQINAYDSIFIESGGKKRFAEELKFDSPEALFRVMNKLLENSQAKVYEGGPMADARTPEGYRIAATHQCIMAKYENRPVSPSIVIRKFPKSRLTFKDLVKSRTLSKDMYEFMRLWALGGLTWLTVGATGSGKTTINEMIAKEIPDEKRINLVQNPSEIKLQKFDSNGRLINNVIEFEAKAIDNPTSKSPTMDNILNHMLRYTPDWIGVGELRRAEEFQTFLKAIQTGHFGFSTMHAFEGEKAIYRFLTSFMEGSNMSEQLALYNICSNIKFIVFSAKLADKTRRILDISEINGLTADGRPNVIPIYKFTDMDTEEIELEDGTKKYIVHGKHKRLNPISKDLQQQLQYACIPRKYWEKFTLPPDDNYEESYEWD